MAAGSRTYTLTIKGGEGNLDHMWRWRARGGQMIYPSEMETRHLMSTIIMVWNHTAPANMRTHDYIKYAFGPEYTPEYMRQAVRIMFQELETRDLSSVPKYVMDRWNTLRSWVTQPDFYEQYGIGETRKITHVQTD